MIAVGLELLKERAEGLAQGQAASYTYQKCWCSRMELSVPSSLSPCVALAIISICCKNKDLVRGLDYIGLGGFSGPQALSNGSSAVKLENKTT